MHWWHLTASPLSPRCPSYYVDCTESQQEVERPESSQDFSSEEESRAKSHHHTVAICCIIQHLHHQVVAQQHLRRSVAHVTYASHYHFYLAYLTTNETCYHAKTHIREIAAMQWHLNMCVFVLLSPGWRALDSTFPVLVWKWTAAREW